MTHRQIADLFCGTNFGYDRFGLQTCLDDIAALGLTHVELWGVAPHLDISAAGPRDIARIRSQLSDRGLAVHCLTPEQMVYPLNIASSDAALRGRSIRYMERGIAIAAELESPLFFLTSGWGLEDEDLDGAWKRSRDALHLITSAAKDAGVRCVLEGLQRWESNLVRSVDDIERMMGEVGEDRLAVALDTIAMAAAGDTIAGYFDRFDERVVHVHLIDGAPTGHLAWGDGTQPIDSWFRELLDRPYEGRVTFEIVSARYRSDPATAHRRSLARACEVMARWNSSNTQPSP